MGLMTKRVATLAALGDDFARPATIKELEQLQAQLEKAIADGARTLPLIELSIFKTRLSYVEQWIWEVKHGVTDESLKPWEWPGPIALPGMKAVTVKDGTYNHVTTTDPKFLSEESEKGDMSKLLDWAQRCGLSRSEAFAQLGGLQPTTYGLGPGLMNQRFSKRVLFELQQKIAKIAAEKLAAPPQEIKPKMGLFKKKEEAKETPAEITQDPKGVVIDPVKEQELANAKERLGLDRQKPANLFHREDVDNVLKDRTAAITELAVITEQFAQASRGLKQRIEDLDLVYEDALAQFFDKNNPTGKKTWVLLHGTLKRANKPISVAQDTERDHDGSLFRAWLKDTHEKDPKLAAKLGIAPLVSYARDMKAVADHFKAEYEKNKKFTPVPGLRMTEARENVFSVAPSVATIVDNINDDLKKRGIK